MDDAPCFPSDSLRTPEPDIEESNPEVIELSAVEYFSSALQTVQRQASVAEGPKKRAHTEGKSDRTIRRHKRAKMKLEAQGFFSLQEFFRRKSESAKRQEKAKAEAKEAAEAAATHSENASDSEASKTPVTAPEEASTASTVPAATEEVWEASNSEAIESEPSVAFTVLTEEEEEEEGGDGEEDVPAVVVVEEEEEEGEEEAGTQVRVLTRPPSNSDLDLSDFERSFWGPSRTILDETESETCCSNNPEDVQPTDVQGLVSLCCRNAPNDSGPQQPINSALDHLRDRAGLQVAQRELSLMARQKILDNVLQGRVVAMVSLLNLYLDDTLHYTWRRASEVASRSEGHGTNRARTVRRWVMNFVRTQELPTHQLGRAKQTVLDDEDIAHDLKLGLNERAKSGFVTASDVVDIVSSPEMQAQFSRAGIHKPSISDSTARRWLSKLGWRYGKQPNGMYIDGHERQDVVEYRQGFVERFAEYEHRFHTWDDAGNELPRPMGFIVPRAIGRFRLILVTHDESTFYQNDQRQICWGCPGSGVPKPKGEGVSLMVSDFLTADWGRLRDNDRCVFVGFPP